jgi:hypothetical protein
LPLPSCLLTLTRPAALRDMVRRQHQRSYAVRFRASAAALQPLAHAPRCLGGQLGLLGVLQTLSARSSEAPSVARKLRGICTKLMIEIPGARV